MPMNLEKLLPWLQSRTAAVGAMRPEFENLSRLTVVIPSYGRHPYLVRQAVYWLGSGARVIVMDGSAQALPAELAQSICASGEFTYIHMPRDICSRLNHAASLISTPYAVMLGDDEFLLKGGLNAAIEKLDAAADYVACIGQAAMFHLSDRNRFVSYGPAYSLWKYSVEGEDVATRLANAFTHYNAASCYAVTRAEVWRRSWGSVRQWAHLPMIELQQAALTYIHGRLTTVDDLYWLRSTERAPVAIKNTWDPAKVSLRAWWEAAQFQEERERYFDLLAQEMVHCGLADQAQARHTVQSALALFVAGQRTGAVAAEGWAGFTLRCKSAVAEWLRERMTEVEYRALWRRVGVRLGTGFATVDELFDGAVPGLPFKPSDRSRAEVREVEQIITGFYANA